MLSIFKYTSIQLFLFLVFLPVSAQISPEMSAEIKDIQIETDYKLAAIPTLLQIGKKIAKDAITKYPEIVPMPLEGGPTFPPGKSGTITFFLREGLVNGNRFMLTQINVSGHLRVENQKDFQSCNVYTSQTPVVGLGDVQEACEQLLKQFYGAYSAARSA